MNKTMISVCFLTFVIGCVGGGVLAYGNHQKGMESQSLLASISQTQDNWEVEQFIREQEEQRPEGLEEAQVATGSKYNGITYNNVSSATVNSSDEQGAKLVEAVKLVGRVSVESGSLNIRSENKIGDNVIGQAYKDELLEIVNQDGVWYQIITAEGLSGYVSSTYVEIVNE